MTQVLSSYYRLPEGWDQPPRLEGGLGAAGFFQFGSSIVCYGESRSGVAESVSGAKSFDALQSVQREGPNVYLPFNISLVIDNLRFENYVKKLTPRSHPAFYTIGHKAYYSVRGLLPIAVRRYLQKLYFKGWKELPFPRWPVDFTVDNLHREYLKLMMEARSTTRVPFIWFWPKAASAALILTHDVETAAGRDFTSSLMDLDSSYQFKASIQVIPEERYGVSDSYVREIRSRGFEFNVHDLNHDGNLYQDRAEFLRRAERINAYVRHYGARGFRSGAMYRNLSWYDAFDFSYDMSVPNVAHLEPQRGGCCTVMPYFTGKILELPLTTSQDYSLFQILNDYSTSLWKEQTELILDRNGLISFISHPDYLIEPQARRVYQQLLEYLRRIADDHNVWVTTPAEVDRWWRARTQMKLVSKAGQWTIEGPENEKASVAYAIAEKSHFGYELARVTETEKVVS